MDITTTTATTTADTNDDVPYDTYYDDDSNCSTPYVSAPSSPRHHLPSRFFFYSAPTSPMHFVLSSSAAATTTSSPPSNHDASNTFEFQLSSRVDSPSAPSADELFLNGQIRPLHLTLQNDVVLERSRESNLRDKSQRRRTRSMSPSRNTPPPFEPPTEATSSASSSRCSSAGRSSKRWLFLKDFLRSKSEGSSNNKFWNNINVSFSKEKEKKRTKKSSSSSSSPSITTSTAGKRRSAHEMHYAANRAQAEEMRKKTYLPYRQGLLGCLGFNSKSYGAFHGFTRAFNPVSST